MFLKRWYRISIVLVFSCGRAKTIRIRYVCMRIFGKTEKKFSVFNVERRTRRGLNWLPLSEDTILRGVSSSSLGADNLQEPLHGVE